jgi:hypothetical protein
LRQTPTNVAIRERLFAEAKSYAEKANVADYVEDRTESVRWGLVKVRSPVDTPSLGKIAMAARRLIEAARELSAVASSRLPIFRVLKNSEVLRVKAANRVNELVQAVTARIGRAARGYSVDRERDPER